MAARQENPRKRDREEEEEGEGFPAPVGDGKLTVKLRIGQKLKKTPAGEGRESPEKKDHVCGECNKRFSSGKALGGHMSSAHVQANRDYSYRRKQLRGGGGKGSGDEDEEDGGREDYRGKDGKIRCFLCGKSFPSTKSLFGHMRCHPDRYWRGMEPPQMQSGNIFDDNKVAEEDEEINHERVDLQGYLWSWASTAKRGRSPIKRSSSSSDEKELREAVHHLVSLCNGDLRQNPNLEIEKKVENNGVVVSKGKGSRFRAEERTSSEDDNGDSNSEWANSKNTESPNSSMAAKKKRRIAEKTTALLQGSTKDASLMPDLQNKGGDGDNNSEKFKCSTCNKCFSSHQALGGHRSSHNKFKISIHNAIDECINAVSGDENNQSYAAIMTETNNNGANATSKSGAAGVDTGNTSGFIHQCSVCGKIFATGRALGGHKRCHSTAQSTQQAAAATSPEGSSTPCSHDDDDQPKILAFDLNEFPDMDGSS